MEQKTIKRTPKWVIAVIIMLPIFFIVLAFAFASDELETSDTNKNNSGTTQKNIDTTIPTEYKNALKKAESYSNAMNMSKQAIYNQLTSEYGEQFTVEAAQYAMDNIKADWNANALAKAKSYQNAMNMSKQAIYDQLISEYGEHFTAEEAQYAIDNLN